MTTARPRPTRAMLLLIIAIVSVAIPRAGRTIEEDRSASGGVVDRAPGVERVIVYNGDTDRFLRALGRVTDFDLVYRYEMVRGAAVAVPGDRVDEVIAFAKTNGLEAVRDAETHADLGQSTKTVHVKTSGSTAGAWSLGYTGKGVSIAIIDSGIDATHMSINDIDDDPLTSDPKVVHFREFAGGVGADAVPNDDALHGTHVSGIAAGTGDGSTGDGPRGNGHVGVAYEANLVGLKVLHTPRGQGTGADFLAALQWLHTNWDNVDPPVRVANMSLSFSGVSNNGDSVYSQAVDLLADVGVVPVASGGNGQCNGSCENTTPGNIGVPGDARKAISVCSSNSATPPAGPTYSNWDSEGPTADGRPKPEVCAPGDSILSAMGGSNSLYIGFGGTSMSAPHVAGISALMVQAFPCITPAQVKQSLIETAREYPSHNSERGYGEALARAAILRADELTNCSAFVASAGGLYSTYVGEHVTLDGTSVGGTPPVTFAWDLDGDGQFDDATGATATFTNTASAGTHTVKVRATDDTDATAVGTGTVEVLSITDVFTDAVEAGINGWTAAGGDGVSAWHQTTVRSNSPTHSWYAGSDLGQVYTPSQTLTLTRAVDLTGVTAERVRLRFARSGSQEPGFDILRAQIKENSASSYTTLASFDNYANGNAWTKHAYDITAYKGKVVQIRFQFTSDEINPVEFADATGPFVDDISIVGVTPPVTDTTPPAPITDLFAGATSETTISLAWTATGDDGATGTAAAYDLRRSLAPITPANFALATHVEGLPTPGPTGNPQSHMVTGLIPNTTYYFSIKAIDEASNSGAISNVVLGSTLPDTAPPSIVTGLTGSAGDASAAITWTAATDNVGVDRYEVFRDGGLALTTAATNALFTGLTNGTTYDFKVRALDTAGNAGAFSNTLSLTPATVRGWLQSRGGGARTGATSGRGSIQVPAIRQTLSLGTDPVDASPLILDLDGDGDLDVVAVSDQTTTATPTTVKAFKQTSTGLQTMWTYAVPLLPGSNSGFGNVAAGDLDLDGTTEVVLYSNSVVPSPVGVSGSVNSVDGRIAVLRGLDGSLLGEIGPTAVSFAQDIPPVIGDVTGDSVPEAVIIHDRGSGGGFFLMAVGAPGGGVSPVFDTAIPGTGWSSIALGELRAAHSGLEVILGRNGGNAAGEVRVCTPNAGNASCAGPGDSVATTTGIMGVSVANLDGAGAPEIVANGRDANSLNVVRTTPPLSVVSRADGFLWNTASLADVDADGKADIVNIAYSNFVNDTAKQGNVSVRGFDGTTIQDKGTLTRMPPPGGSTQSKGGGALVDIAGDSRPELVFGSGDGNLVGVSFNSPPAPLWSLALGANPIAPIAVGDVTGDGLLDLVGGTAAGSLFVVGAGPAAQLKITPPAATVAAGVTQAYTAETFDAVGNRLADVTGSTTFSIVGGNCAANSCSSTTAGAHTVSGTMGSLSGTATLNVSAGPLDHIVVSPSTATITAGGSQAYTVEGFDQYDNSRGDVTSSSTFAITPNGSCTGASCSATVAGVHTVTATNGSVSASSSLSVVAGALDHLDLQPQNAAIMLGASQTYTVTGRDQYNNSLGDMTAATVFTIAPRGTCTANSCTDTVAGSHLVTGRFGTVSGTASLNIVNSIHHLVLSPSSATITAGGSQAYTAQAYDANNVALGDVTTQATFSISPDGACTSNVCSASRAGNHVVTANVNGATGAAALIVNPGPMTQLIITPGFATITPGGTKTYQASGRDAFGNVLGNMTASTVFSIAPDGSCSANVCGATLTGSHTVTGTSGGVSGTATLQVNPFAPVIVTPAQGAVTPKQVTVSGTAPLGTTVRLSDNGMQIADNVAVDGSGAWSIDKVFAGGTHNLTARAVVGTSISDPSATRMFTVDTTPPSSVVTRPSGYVLFHVVLPGEQPEVSGTASDNGLGIDRVEVAYTELLTGAEAHTTLTCSGPCKTFAWTDTPALGLGLWTVEAVAYDRGGNASAADSINMLVIAASMP